MPPRQARLLRGARRSAQRLRAGDQVRLPQARAQAPSRPQPRRQGTPRSASRRPPRPTASWAIPRSAGATTPSATRASGGAAARRLRSHDLRRLRRHPRRLLRLRRRLRAAPRRPAPRRGPALQPRAHVRGGRLRHRDAASRSRALETCATCSGSGSAPGHQRPRPAPPAAARGQVTFQQGFFSVARTCGRCRGAGRIVAHAVQGLPRRGAASEPSGTLQLKIPAGVDTRQPAAHHRRGRGRRPGRSPGRPLRRRARAGARLLPARRRRPALRDARQLPAGGAGRHDRRAHTRRRDDQAPRPRGHADRHRAPGARPGRAAARRRGRGDLHVIVRVVVPTQLTPRAAQAPRAARPRRFPCPTSRTRTSRCSTACATCSG